MSNTLKLPPRVISVVMEKAVMMEAVAMVRVMKTLMKTQKMNLVTTS
jgi:hypothetical protein